MFVYVYELLQTAGTGSNKLVLQHRMKAYSHMGVCVCNHMVNSLSVLFCFIFFMQHTVSFHLQLQL